jgi:aryl-alcohol dehydrogenase-like predicted oxidoreductase
MGGVSEQQAIATVQAAVDAGMTFIDTAESYRTSESLIGKALRGRRHEVFLATKLSGDHSPGHMARAIENSLKALGTDYVDLYQLHGPQPKWPIGQTMQDLFRLRDAGKIRYIGISNFSAEQTLEALKHGPIHSSQPRYSMLFRDAEESVLPCCLENGIGVIPHSVLAKGLLTGRYRPGHDFPSDDERSSSPHFGEETFSRAFEITERLKQWAADHGRDLVQLAIAWTLAHPAVTSSIVGAKSPEQARHNARAADWSLTETDLKEIDEIQEDLRLHA